MSQGKPFTLYGTVVPPNPMKVAIVLEELGLEYEVVPIEISKREQKSPEFLKLNPNGRVPALVDDTNEDFVIWESDAILLYLVERYDKEHKLSVADANEKYTLLQWLFFQASGQGPYFGQAVWFMRGHREKLPSAIQRYQKETIRVIGVLESVLSNQEWLVGGKMTIADLSFVPWSDIALTSILKDYEGFDVDTQFPAFSNWHKKMCARPTVAKQLAIRDEYMSKLAEGK
ncbi:glutathione S-transferase C-terminal-like protein [Cubamyces sp. BRFM 1775]|nr:glutathione S-transferase C-terminal-like protein [Cubamyces sp. BRFM 1775]